FVEGRPIPAGGARVLLLLAGAERPVQARAGLGEQPEDAGSQPVAGALRQESGLSEVDPVDLVEVGFDEPPPVEDVRPRDRGAFRLRVVPLSEPGCRVDGAASRVSPVSDFDRGFGMPPTHTFMAASSPY